MRTSLYKHVSFLSSLYMFIVAENGRTEPSNMALVEIADYFNVSVDYLLGRTDNPNMLKGVS